MKFNNNAAIARRPSSFIAKAAIAASLGLAFSSQAVAGTTATTTATFEVTAINEIDLAGSPPSLTVSAAVAGLAPTPVSASQTYAVTTNQTAKISAAIDTNMPSGLVLTASMAAPTGATSNSAVALSDASQDLVTGITGLNQSGLQLTYGLSATAAAGVVASSTRTVTYTITAI
jgi:hypothetical protein